MKLPLLAALLLAVPLAGAAAAADVVVNLRVNAGTADAPAWRECDVAVPEAADGGIVLDQAVANGCILEWSSATFPGFGRYVTSIDHVGEAVATYWAFYIGGEYATVGIDDYAAADGDALQFTYEQWAVFLG